MRVLLTGRQVRHDAIRAKTFVEVGEGLPLRLGHEHRPRDVVLVPVLLLDRVELVGRVVSRPQRLVVNYRAFIAEPVLDAILEHPRVPGLLWL